MWLKIRQSRENPTICSTGVEPDTAERNVENAMIFMFVSVYRGFLVWERQGTVGFALLDGVVVPWLGGGGGGG